MREDAGGLSSLIGALKWLAAGLVLLESRRLGPFVPRVQDDSVVMDLMIHDIDIVLGLVDSEPRRMNALGRSIHSRQADVANVQILFDSGAMATITASRGTEEKIRTLSITQPRSNSTMLTSLRCSRWMKWPSARSSSWRKRARSVTSRSTRGRPGRRRTARRRRAP